MQKFKKIAFVGYKNSFSFSGIGGSESIVRRLSLGFLKDFQVFHLKYGHVKEFTKNNTNNIIECNFPSFTEMLSYVEHEQIKNMLVIYLKPYDYFSLAKFILSNPQIFFHLMATGIHSSFLKSSIYLILNSYILNGQIFCVSKRIQNKFSFFTKRISLILPPVDDSFFRTKNEFKKKSHKRIAYMGRLDYGKGADISINYFNKSNLVNKNYEFYIYAYPDINDKRSIEMHKSLTESNKINYIETKRWDSYTKEMDIFLANTIDDVDLFFLPYRTINSTIDTPLVPLEILSRRGKFICPNFNQLNEIIFNKDFKITDDLLNNFDLLDKEIEHALNTWDATGYDSFINDLNFKTSNSLSIIKKYLK